MKLAFSIGMRFLKFSKGQTLLIIIGIIIGVAVQVFVGSLIEGLQVSLIDGTIGNSPHVTLSSEERGETFDRDDALIDKLKADDRLLGVSSSFSNNGFVLEADNQTYPVLLRGFEFDDANDIYNFEESLVEGDLPSGDKEIIIGQEFADEVELAIGDTVQFIATTDETEELYIVGVFDLGVSSLNESWVISELDVVQTVFGEEGQLTSIELQIVDVFEADAIASEIENMVNDQGLEATNWQQENESLLSGLTGQSISSYMIQIFVLVAVLLGIASVLAISAVQKSKQLGILKAMGIKDKIAGQIFLFQGFILGSVGALAGAGVGMGLMYAFSFFVKNPDGSALVPFYVDTQFVVLSVVIAIVASTIAAFIPAKNSSRLNPIEVIQNG